MQQMPWHNHLHLPVVKENVTLQRQFCRFLQISAHFCSLDALNDAFILQDKPLAIPGPLMLCDSQKFSSCKVQLSNWYSSVTLQLARLAQAEKSAPQRPRPGHVRHKKARYGKPWKPWKPSAKLCQALPSFQGIRFLLRTSTFLLFPKVKTLKKCKETKMQSTVIAHP